MIGVLRQTWALFLGVGLLALGSGLQNSLLGLRAEIESFPTTLIGLVATAFYGGFLAGSLVVPTLIERVGHVRAFAALASLASTTALLHVVFIDPGLWIGLRLVSGFAYAGLVIIAESWLNDRADNTTRGQLLAAYMVINVGAQGLGQLLLNLESPAQFQLFVLVSVLISLSLIPLLLSVAPVPAVDAPQKVALRELYRVSPLGVVGSFSAGLAHGALLGLGAVFARGAGLSVGEVSLFMGAVYLGAVVLQWPIGRLSDIFDRRRVIAGVTGLAALVAMIGANVEGDTPALVTLALIFGGLSLPVYSLCVSHTNDYLGPRQMVAASAALYFVTGLGAVLGPITASAAMSALGSPGFFVFLAAVHGALGLFAVWRMARRAALPLTEQGSTGTSWAAAGSQVATAMAAEVYAADAWDGPESRDGDMAEATDDGEQGAAVVIAMPDLPDCLPDADREPGGDDCMVA